MLAVEDRRHQQSKSDDRHFPDLAGAEISSINAHQHGDGDGRENCERAPGRMRQRLDNNERQHGQQNDHDHQHADHGDCASRLAEFRADHVAERAPVAPRRCPEHNEVLHRACKNDADEQPERSGQISHLRGKHRPNQRPRTRNGREVVAEQYVSIGRAIVETVVEAVGGCRSRGIDAQNFVGDELPVKSIGDEIDRDGGRNQPDSVDRLAARECDDAE